MIGTDIVDKRRMAQLFARHPEASARRILHPRERPALATTSDPVRLLALRWAAKEAFAKALGTGLRAPVTMPKLGVYKDAQGAPHFFYEPELQRFFEARGFVGFALSLSDERDFALAFVLGQRTP